ncbi:MAG: gliding motility-associated C-terminal domain-containing protein [Bacteroidales bacterium]|jgi:hypothetical protein|nr:gliding motility-associated C-terminal domain-containing protein [Bacteroidales bacterium]
MKKYLLILCALAPLMSFAQIHEMFKHRDSLNHQWFGDTAYFYPQNGILQLQGQQTSSTLQYAVANVLCDSVEWNFKIELGFNPSSTNYVRVYLMSDTNNLKGALNGYFLQLGQTGGKNNIQIFRQEGSKNLLIFSGISVFDASGGLSVRLRIKRFPNGEWQVFSDVGSDLPIIPEGEVFVDSTFQKTVAFGFYCRYSTASRYNRYAFGEVKVCEIESDPIPDPPVIIEDSDIVITEIMFNPMENSAEYIEIFNHSEQDVRLSELYLAIFDEQDILSRMLAVATHSELTIPSKMYAVLSKTPDKLSQFHSICLDANLVEMPNFPALSNTSARLALTRKDSTRIDEIYYHTSMHYALLADTKGVSLERLDFEKSGTETHNWHSASKISGYATPGCPNSQGVSVAETDELLQLYPTLISPDNDGMDDVLSLSYHLEAPGFTGNIRIFNSNGRVVKHLVKSELLGTQGTYHWDGLSEQNTKLPSGIYIIVFDIFSLNGQMLRVKKPVGYK